MTANKQVIRFMSFSANPPRNFIDQVWSGDMHIDVIRGRYFRRTFLEFFLLLDVKNQNRLIEWVNKNYEL